MTVKIYTFATVPDDLAHAWLQHLRDFDTTHPGCHFEVIADMHNLSTAEVVETLRIHPELSIMDVLKRGKPDADRD